MRSNQKHSNGTNILLLCIVSLISACGFTQHGNDPQNFVKEAHGNIRSLKRTSDFSIDEGISYSMQPSASDIGTNNPMRELPKENVLMSCEEVLSQYGLQEGLDPITGAILGIQGPVSCENWEAGIGNPKCSHLSDEWGVQLEGFVDLTGDQPSCGCRCLPSPCSETVLLQKACQERSSLVDLYNSTNGPQWTNSLGWQSDAACPYNSPNDIADPAHCSWFGVECAQNSECPNSRVVKKVRMMNNNLQGTLNPTLNKLEHLEVLWLGSNSITGQLPSELGEIIALKDIRIGFAELTGPIPSEFSNLVNLKMLILPANDLSGSLSVLGNLTSLTSIDLLGNEFTGSIPSSLGSLTNLQYLGLAFNQLSGSIPSELGNATNLTGLVLEQNQLSGEVPETLQNLTNLNPWNVRFRGNQCLTTSNSGFANWLSSLDMYWNDGC